MIDYLLANSEAITLGFGFCASLFAIIRIFSWFRNKDIDSIQKTQRAKWQAEFFDRNYKDYIDLRDKYDDLLERLVVLEIHDKARN